MAVDPAPDFPKPEWPPIQDLESVDITGKRKDGGVDLLIAVSQPLDGSADTLAAIRGKIGYYLDVIDLPEFQAEMGHPPRDRTLVVLACSFPIHPWAAAVVAECQATAARRGVRVVVQE
ncbi:MAG: hypothetical protein K2V38_27990 [Gemmataceae bacterium]|nr:hypothetical protein [Gemmataceae bacterium]